MVKGLVIRNTGSWYTVLTDDGRTVDCKVKGNFRLKGIRSTNPVAVGDRVTISPAGGSNAASQRSKVQSPADGSNAASQRSKVQSPAGGSNAASQRSKVQSLSGVQCASRVQESNAASQRSKDQEVAGGSEVAFITEIEDRKNYIIRKSSNLSKQSHIIAANVDQAFLIVTVNYPETSTTFIDRFLASAEAYSVPVVLVFNKLDLLNADERHIQQMLITLYENIGYQCVEVSAQTGEGIDRLHELLEGRITLLSGNSGVGKSTLINRLVPGVNLRTSEISDAHKTGMHTTTFSEMIKVAPPPDPSPVGRGESPTPDPSPVGRGIAWLIDTPGIKGFGTFDMEPEELTSYFREIFHFSKGCRFSNCTHTHEPGCAVLKALEDHYIAQSRYQSYLSMMEDKEDGKYRAAY